ncbi:hypothetical protein DENSPDRAFT_422809 [Dentipellis sp. KUC8613]|nr:hypothetical protein DENSPDRAFT_422809 [Dentipellis sp. KUC8613]
MSPDPEDASSTATSGGSDERSNKRRAPTLGPSETTPEATHVQDPFDTANGSTIRLQYEKDKDLTSQLPSLSVVEFLVDYYFENCNWVHYGIHRQSFGEAWVKYKTGQHPCRLVLATVSIIMAAVLCYLPAGHELQERLPGNWATLTEQYYKITLTALERHSMDRDVYTLELVELLLLKCQYLAVTKPGGEEAWRVRGDLISIATAMGLHRDPAHSEMPLLLAERRRWAWWNIVVVERWQALMLGRPLAIATYHFDTRLPSYGDPSADKSGRLHAANIALFRLAHVMGDIVDGIVAVAPVPYVTVVAKDRLLLEWSDSVTPDLDFNHVSLARGLASHVTSSRRVAVQCLFLRILFLHLRLALHQPYVHPPYDISETTSSLGVATECAGQLISLSTHVCPDSFGSTLPPTLSHLRLIPYHILGAALLFVFLVCENPDQSAAHAYRTNIYKSVATLHQLHRAPLAEPALAILRILEPLYGESFITQDDRCRVREKAEVLSKLRLLLAALAARPTTVSASSDEESQRTHAQADTLLQRYSATMPSMWERLVSQAMPQTVSLASSVFSAAAYHSMGTTTPPSSFPPTSTIPSTPASADVLPSDTPPLSMPMNGHVGGFLNFSAISPFPSFPLVEPERFHAGADGHPPAPDSPTSPNLDIVSFMRSVDEGNWAPPAGFKDELAQFFDGLHNGVGGATDDSVGGTM